MYPVTQDFLDKMKADRRQVLARVEIDYTDPFMDQSLTIEANEKANHSYPQQTADSVDQTTHKYACLDGTWDLTSGEYHLAPSPGMLSQYQMGWWGAQLAGVGGAFTAPYPTLTVTHFPRPIRQLKVVGDTAREEYPVDFTIKLYAQDDTLLKTETVTGNDQVSWSKALEPQVLDVAKQVLEITKWSHAGRCAKIIEFFTSIREVYETGDLVSIRLLEEREASQGSLPVGNISSNEITLALNNEDKKFDVDNEQSPLKNLLKPNRRIQVWLGAETEVPFAYEESGEDFEQGELYGVVAGKEGLELKQIQYTNIVEDGDIPNLSKWNNTGTLITNDGVFGNTSVEYGYAWGCYQDFTNRLIEGRYYFVSAYARVVSETGTGRPRISYGGLEGTNIYGEIENHEWHRFGDKRVCIDSTIKEFRLLGNPTGTVVRFDGVMVIEITEEEYNNLSVEELMTKYPFVTESGTTYELNGSRISPPFGLSSVCTVKTSQIRWQATEPTGTSLKVETSLSTDGGQTWGDWQEAINRHAIPGIAQGMDLTNAKLKTRVTLETEDTSITPKLYSLKIEIYDQDAETTEEYVPLGTFWSLDWDSPDDTLEATVTARDRMELLRKSTFQTSQVLTNKSLYELAEIVLQDAGLNSSEYIIDTSLQSIIIPYAWFNPVSHREALRRIAEAGLAAAFQNRDGKIQIESFLITGDEPVLEITEDDYFPPLRAPSRQDQVANEIIVDTQPLRPAAVAEEVYKSNEPITIPGSSTKTITAFYNQPPVIDAAASLDSPPSGVNITDVTYYGWGASVSIRNTNATDKQVTLIINGKPLTVRNKERAIARDEASILENGVLRYEFPANPLVQTLAQAQAIADALLASVKEPRRDIEVDWRGNPALLLGDRVTVKNQDYHVIRQEIEWAGALSARMTGRRVV